MNFLSAIKSGFDKQFDFSGRASRTEYWYWQLFLIVVSVNLALIDMLVPTAFPNLVFLIATYLPSISLSIRRLHDINRSGWWLLLLATINVIAYSLWLPDRAWWGLVPVAGSLATLICWYCKPGDAGSNRFGANPFGGSSIIA